MAKPTKRHPEQTVTIDGVSYPLNELSEAARAELTSLQVTDQYLQHTKHRLSMLQTARAAYAQRLAEALPARPAAPATQPEADATVARFPTADERFFWHAIGPVEASWWRYLVNTGQLAVSFDNSPGDGGEALLRRYRPGDVVIAYARGKGALGWARIDDPVAYRFVPQGAADDQADGDYRHRLGVTWHTAAESLDQAVSASEIRALHDLRHPTRPSVAIEGGKGLALLKDLQQRLPILRPVS